MERDGCMHAGAEHAFSCGQALAMGAAAAAGPAEPTRLRLAPRRGGRHLGREFGDAEVDDLRVISHCCWGEGQGSGAGLWVSCERAAKGRRQGWRTSALNWRRPHSASSRLELNLRAQREARAVRVDHPAGPLAQRGPRRHRLRLGHLRPQPAWVAESGWGGVGSGVCPRGAQPSRTPSCCGQQASQRHSLNKQPADQPAAMWEGRCRA